VDDLSELVRVGRRTAQELVTMGYHSFADIASWSADDLAKIQDRFGRRIDAGICVRQAQGRVAASERGWPILLYGRLRSGERQVYQGLNAKTLDRRNRGLAIKIDEDWAAAKDLSRNFDTGGMTYIVHGGRALFRTFQDLGWLPGTSQPDARQEFRGFISSALYSRRCVLVDYDTFPTCNWRAPIVLHQLHVDLLRRGDPEMLSFEGDWDWDHPWEADTIDDQIRDLDLYRKKIGEPHRLVANFRQAQHEKRRR